MQNLNVQHLKDEQPANEWLKENGITNRLFKEVQGFQLQAYKTATNILKHNVKLLKTDEYELLISYCKRMLNSKQRNSITTRSTYQILNIGTRINRQLLGNTEKSNNIRQNLQISNCSKSKCKNADCNITANESALSYSLL